MRLAERLLAALLPEPDRAALLGDLAEECDRRPGDANRIMRREIMAAAIRLPRRMEESMRFVLVLGVLGGAALVATVMLSRRGPMIFLPYAAIVIATWIVLRVQHVEPFTHRFLSSLGAFMLATLVLYLFIGFVATSSAVEIPLLGHAWRLGLMLLIGNVLSAAVAWLSAPNVAIK